MAKSGSSWSCRDNHKHQDNHRRSSSEFATVECKFTLSLMSLI